VTRAAGEKKLPTQFSCQDPLSKSVELPDLLVILGLPITDFHWLQSRRLSTFSGILLVEGLQRTSIAFNGLPAIYEASLQQFFLSFAHWIIPESLLNHTDSFRGRMSEFEAKREADSWSTRSVTVNTTVTRHTNYAVAWLIPQESDCSRMRRKASSAWLPIYIKATRPVLEIFTMAGYFLDRLRTAWKRFIVPAICWLLVQQCNKFCVLLWLNWLYINYQRRYDILMWELVEENINSHEAELRNVSHWYYTCLRCKLSAWSRKWGRKGKCMRLTYCVYKYS
jgi:hypothetical protein